MKPRLLDLFCGAGGASMGYHRAGFEVIGVDIAPQPRYPFEFVQSDALGWDDWDFDAVHASPPCQAYTLAQRIRGYQHADLIERLRELIEASGLSYVIENVKRSPLNDPVMLEGQMFPELRTHRPRLFETNWPLEAPFMRPPPPPNAKMGRAGDSEQWAQLVGHFTDVEGGKVAIGIDWMTRDEMAEAIPPAYTEFIGLQLLAHLDLALIA